MTMSYTEMEVSRAAIRTVLVDYLRENRSKLTLPRPGHITNAARYWFDATKQTGISVDKLADEIYQRLIGSSVAKCTKVRVDDSTVMNAFKAYIPLRTQITILEEVFELIRAGILMSARLIPRNEGINFDFLSSLDTSSLMLTDYGVRFLDREPIPPYYTEPYLERLRQTAEPDDELQGYLSEGLACLRNHLSRAAAILLRIAAEHTLNALMESTTVSIEQEKEQQKFKGQVRSAGIKIEERAEVVFRKLESSAALIPNRPYFRNMVNHRLRPAFHSIRDLGGKAAHIASAVQLEEVADHYTLYASTVYPITVEIIKHQKAL